MRHSCLEAHQQQMRQERLGAAGLQHVCNTCVPAQKELPCSKMQQQRMGLSPASSASCTSWNVSTHSVAEVLRGTCVHNLCGCLCSMVCVVCGVVVALKLSGGLSDAFCSSISAQLVDLVKAACAA